ncbi:hypothetical protein C7374_10797 [Falsochrobactrum ovis]|uniref:Uncharacterized protein n=1 Tax=Falsochrobactrum ovis TaxID=1293442 RepID=A0A364JUP5_9HYPH|nr:hypothetical protein C7374_10797 [Falsochrobactrum ovis]
MNNAFPQNETVGRAFCFSDISQNDAKAVRNGVLNFEAELNRDV